MAVGNFMGVGFVAGAVAEDSVGAAEEDSVSTEAKGEDGWSTENIMKRKLLCLLVFVFAWPYFVWNGQGQPDQPAVTSQRSFASPAEAKSKLLDAAKARNRQAIRDMFGPEVTNLWTGDQALDEKHFEAFARDLTQRCDLVPEGSDRVTIEIGTNRWPFPIPLIQTNGAWRFDTIAGEEEIINRHIGQDEYYAIGVCRAYVKAQREYGDRLASTTGAPQYAEKFKSAPGKRDGLCWPAEGKAKASPLSSFVAEASAEGYDWTRGNGPRPFNGYCFKILKRQGAAASGGKKNYISHGEMTGGFALVAYPVRWGQSGIMTFIVNQDGVVYQRSLGPDTARKAAAMQEYNPDKRWTVVNDEGTQQVEDDVTSSSSSAASNASAAETQ